MMPLVLRTFSYQFLNSLQESLGSVGKRRQQRLAFDVDEAVPVGVGFGIGR